MAQVPDQHSLLPLPDHFVIAGDRFREEYYWDSYWIVQGLINCGLVDTAQVLQQTLVFAGRVPPDSHCTTVMGGSWSQLDRLHHQSLLSQAQREPEGWLMGAWAFQRACCRLLIVSRYKDKHLNCF